MTAAPLVDRACAGSPPSASSCGAACTHSLRDVESLLMAIMLPVMLMLMFTFVFGGAIEPGGDYVDYVVPGIILLCAGFGAASTAVYVANDMQAGIIDRFRTMPLRAGAVLTGHVVASLVRNLLATGSSCSSRFWSDSVPARRRRSGSARSGSSRCTSSRSPTCSRRSASPRAARRRQAATGSSSSSCRTCRAPSCPVETMPEWLQPVARFQPITPIIETIRALLMGTPLGPEAWWSLAWCVAILGIAAAWGAWLFRRKAGRR